MSLALIQIKRIVLPFTGYFQITDSKCRQIHQMFPTSENKYRRRLIGRSNRIAPYSLPAIINRLSPFRRSILNFTGNHCEITESLGTVTEIMINLSFGIKFKNTILFTYIGICQTVCLITYRIEHMKQIPESFTLRYS